MYLCLERRHILSYRVLRGGGKGGDVRREQSPTFVHVFAPLSPSLFLGSFFLTPRETVLDDPAR